MERHTDIERLVRGLTPFSAVIVKQLAHTIGRNLINEFFNAILNDPRADVLHLDSIRCTKTTCYPEHNGFKSQYWGETKEMAETLNRYGKSVCFLPEIKGKTSADAIILFHGRWTVADFKYSTTDNYNTIATALEKGFKQAPCCVLKMERGNLSTFKEVVWQLQRKEVKIGDIAIINKYNELYELPKQDFNWGKYRQLLRGFF